MKNIVLLVLLFFSYGGLTAQNLNYVELIDIHLVSFNSSLLVENTTIEKLKQRSFFHLKVKASFIRSLNSEEKINYILKKSRVLNKRKNKKLDGYILKMFVLIEYKNGGKQEFCFDGNGYLYTNGKWYKRNDDLLLQLLSYFPKEIHGFDEKKVKD